MSSAARFHQEALMALPGGAGAADKHLLGILSWLLNRQNWSPPERLEQTETAPG